MDRSNSQAVLKGFVDRIERLDAERRALGEDIKDVFAEARISGFDLKALRKVLALRRVDPGERSDHLALIDLYLGLLGDAP